MVPGAFLRTYVGDDGLSWIVIYGVPARRHKLDLLDRCIVEAANGRRDVPQLADVAADIMGRRIAAYEVDERVRRLLTLGILTSGERTTLYGAQVGNLISRKLDSAATAKITMRTPPGALTACDGRGGCCRLYDRIGLYPDDVANVREAFAQGELTPGGLTLESAIRPDSFGTQDLYAIAVRDGACVLLEEDGKCSVHARLGLMKKPLGCRQYPMRDILCEGELHVGLAVECRCLIDFAETGQPIDDAAREVFERRLASGELEEVNGSIGASTRARWPRREYVIWRERALAAVATSSDVVAWAMDEAAHAAGAPGNVHPALSALLGMVEVVGRYFDDQARDTALAYAKADLERELFAWAARATRQLAAELRGEAPPSPALPGERFLVEQVLFTHNCLRFRMLSSALASIAIRIAAARAGANLEVPPMLHPLSAMEVLFRAHGAGFLVDSEALDVERALGAPV